MSNQMIIFRHMRYEEGTACLAATNNTHTHTYTHRSCHHLIVSSSRLQDLRHRYSQNALCEPGIAVYIAINTLQTANDGDTLRCWKCVQKNGRWAEALKWTRYRVWSKCNIKDNLIKTLERAIVRCLKFHAIYFINRIECIQTIHNYGLCGLKTK